MSRPTDEELKVALEQAAYLRENGLDEHHMAKALLNLNYRIKYLEDVAYKAKHYLHFGQDARAHQLLMTAIEDAEKASAYLGKEREDFGLE
jgi:hypothetical protein